MAVLNDDFPVPLKTFVKNHLVKTENEVWIKLLEADHGRENHSEKSWMDILNAKRNQPV